MGLHTNADSKVSAAERAKREKEERQDALIQAAVDKASKDGPSIDMLVGKDAQYATTYDRLAEQKAYAAGDKQSLIPIAIDMNQYPFRWILSDADMDAVMAGYYCHYCLCRHDAVWQPACTTCGMDRDLSL